MKRFFTSPRSQGFSILELTIVIGVLSMIAAAGLSIASTRMDDERRKLTRERIDTVMKAVEWFVATNGYLPCPSDNAKAPAENDFGRGTGSNEEPENDRCIEVNLGPSDTGNIVAGGVPFIQLQIAPEYTVDGWNRRFTFVVDRDLTYIGNFSDRTVDGDIIIQDESAASLLINHSEVDGSVSDAGAAVLVISHGPDGHGAWRYKGGATRLDLGIADNHHQGRNSHVVEPENFDNIFRYMQPRTTSAGGGVFDDILEWRTKWQLQHLTPERHVDE